MKEKILEALCDLGFKTEECEGLGCAFRYEGLNMLYLNNDDDNSEFLSIAVPGIYECGEEPCKMMHATALNERVNYTLRYVKAYILHGNVWLFYERAVLSENEDLRLVLSHIVQHLAMAYFFAGKVIEEIEGAKPDDSPGSDVSTDDE